MTKAHLHLGRAANGDHTIRFCYAPYTKSGIGSISQVYMESAENEKERTLYVADGQDYSSNKPGYQPKALGAFTTPSKAQEAIRMHARYAGGFDDPELFEEAEILQDDKALDIIVDALAARLNANASREDRPLRAEDAKEAPTTQTRTLPPEMAAFLADAPQQVIDTVMKLNDSGAIAGVRLIEIDMDHDD